MSTMFLIGEMSKLFQIDIRTLRYYDEIQLFTPAYVDNATGYRYYSIEQFERLNTILYLKALNLEMPIRILENSHNLRSSIFLGQVGLTISVTSLQERNFDEYHSLFLFVEPDTSKPLKSSVKHLKSSVKHLPRQHYLTIRFAGTHADASPYYEKLMAYASREGYSITDDALEITYIDYGITQDTSSFVTEIQIPVRKH